MGVGGGASRTALRGASTLLLLTGLTTLFAWGSAADIDLDAGAEGGAETFLLEEAPVTPVRLVLLNTGALYVSLSLMLLWRFPPLIALAALLLLDAILLCAGWKAGHHFIRRALR